jgi:hypothetical protein
MQLEDVSPQYRKMMRKFDEKVRRWRRRRGVRERMEGAHARTATTYIKNKIILRRDTGVLSYPYFPRPSGSGCATITIPKHKFA